MHRASRVLFLVGVLFLAGCATQPAQVCDQLFFGRGIPGGGEVSDAQWNAFVAEVVVPRFPEGFTVIRTDGHWKGDDGVTASERGFLLEKVHDNNPAMDAKVEEIAKAYRDRFHQEAVLGVRLPVTIKFWRREGR